MIQIGRKIYFEKLTGNVLVDTGERVGMVVETNVEQDFQSYLELRSRATDSVGLIQLKYGELSDKFNSSTGYKIDITRDVIDKNAIVFSYTNNNSSLEEVKMAKMSELNKDCEESILNTFKSTAFDGVKMQPYDCKLTDQSRINGLVNLAQLRLLGQTTEVIKWKNSDELQCVEWQPQSMIMLGLDLKRHIERNIDKYESFKVYIAGLTDANKINSINWNTTI